MAELRALAAAVLASAAWLLFAQLPGRFELSSWYVILMVILFVAGPAVLAALVNLPHVTGEAMKVPAVAAAIIPPFVVWLVLLPNTTDDGTPSRLLSIPIFAFIASIGGLLAWGTAGVVQAVQEERGERQT
jgi:hypothetical protein